MKQNSKYKEQTHFIGVLPPGKITLALEDCRKYMNKVYGCKSGYGTPIHVTLVPPFVLPEEFSTADLAKTLQKQVFPFAKSLKFDAQIDNFEFFGERTIFAKVVQSEEWTTLRNKVRDAVLLLDPDCIKKDKRPFQPHLTVANRDIPSGTIIEALKIMNNLHFVETFPVDNITVFENYKGKWTAAWTGEM